VTLIGSNCPASRVGRCVDCEGGRTAPVFSDCAITNYLSRATARLTEALLNNPGLQGRPAARPPTVASPVGQYPGTCSGDSVIGRTTVLQCCVLLPACLQFLHMVMHFRIVSYRDILCDIVSYRIVSLTAVSCHHSQCYNYR